MADEPTPPDDPEHGPEEPAGERSPPGLLELIRLPLLRGLVGVVGFLAVFGLAMLAEGSSSQDLYVVVPFSLCLGLLTVTPAGVVEGWTASRGAPPARVGVAVWLVTLAALPLAMLQATYTVKVITTGSLVAGLQKVSTQAGVMGTEPVTLLMIPVIALGFGVASFVRLRRPGAGVVIGGGSALLVLSMAIGNITRYDLTLAIASAPGMVAGFTWGLLVIYWLSDVVERRIPGFRRRAREDPPAQAP